MYILISPSSSQMPSPHIFQVKFPTPSQAKFCSSESLPGWGSEPRLFFRLQTPFSSWSSWVLLPLHLPLSHYPFPPCSPRFQPASWVQVLQAFLHLLFTFKMPSSSLKTLKTPPLICALPIGSSTYSLPVPFSAICDLLVECWKRFTF